MKKLALTLTLTLACAAAFAQGKVRFVNDSLHLVYFGDAPQAGQGLLAGDQAGSVVPAGGPTSQALSVDLWAGTSASTLVKVATTGFAGQLNQGIFGGVNVSLPAPMNAAGTYFFQVQVYDTAAGSAAAAQAANGDYYGYSTIFQSGANSGTAYYSIVQNGSPANSTWVGTHAQPDYAGGSGALGAIALYANVPEPTSFALLGLGAAGMMIFRRRK